MVYSPVSTDLVQLRIATSLIDKLDIPENCKDILFDGMIAAYWIRKHAYDNFYFTEIINLPFLPSARMSKCPF
jgi:D-alanyl-lipoteichoic acid acyltransferase DltB (MBOAT superfamily)